MKLTCIVSVEQQIIKEQTNHTNVTHLHHPLMLGISILPRRKFVIADTCSSCPPDELALLLRG